MAIPKRNSGPNHNFGGVRTFFVTTSTLGRRPFFQVARHCELFLKILYEYRASSKYLLHDFCLMRDHVHLLLTVPEGLAIEKAVQLVKGGFAFRAGKELVLRGTIWQRGFSEVRILDQGGFIARRHYIRQNPVRAGLVPEADEYEFSSAYSGHELDALTERISGAKARTRGAACGTTKVMP